MYNLDAGNNLNTSFPTNSQRLFLSFYGYRTAPGFLGGTSVSDSPGGIFLGAPRAEVVHITGHPLLLIPTTPIIGI